MDERSCTWCRESKPLSEFGRDKRRPDGLRSECKACLREKTRARRRGDAPRAKKRLGLVLAPTFPDPPAAVVEEDAPPAADPAAVGSMRAEIETHLAALDPVPGPGDAAIVAQCRSLADLYDRVYWTDDASRACPSLAGKITAALRELNATRASTKAPTKKPARASAANF